MPRPGIPAPRSPERPAGRRPSPFPDETVTTKAPSCAHRQATLTEADQVLHGRYDKIDLPMCVPW